MTTDNSTFLPRVEKMAMLACAFAGVMWGLFWIPLRAAEADGIHGVWAALMFYVIPAPLVIPLLIWRWKQFTAGGWRLHLLGFLTAGSLVLYSNSMLYTEVIRAMLLYYVTPVWSTILGRLLLGEAITPTRVFAMCLGIFGMLVIFGIDVGIPLPRNIGDWMGLAAGIVWAMAATSLRWDPSHHPLDLMTSYFIWSTLIALVMVALPIASSPPPLSVFIDALPWMVPAIMLIVIPATVAIMWGVPYLNPGIVGLLFMTEISVGAITVAIWAGEPFGIREIVGVVLISSAGLAEVISAPMMNLGRKLRQKASA